MIRQKNFSDFSSLIETLMFNMYFISQKLSNDPEVGLFQVLETWELFVKVLSQVENLLRHIENLIFVHPANMDQSGHDLCVDEILFLELLADLEGHIDGPNGEETWVSSGELEVVH